MSKIINSVLVSKKLLLLLNNGVDTDGNAKTLTKSFSHINAQATAAQMKASADDLASVMANDVANVYDVTKNSLVEIDDEGD